MDEPAKIAPTRTVGDVFGKFGIPDGFEGYASTPLDELSHDTFGFLISEALDLSGEAERVHEELTESWARCYELLADGGVARRSA